MRRLMGVISIILLVLNGCVSKHCGDRATTIVSRAHKETKIGIYDSRSVAIAYCGSEIFNKRMAKLREEHEKATSIGDKERAARLEIQGKEIQKLLHKQGFSTAPVDDILDSIKDRLPAIKQNAGVGLLVSKWNKKMLEKYSANERVDVTMDMINAFDPKEKSRKSAIEIQKHKPILMFRADQIGGGE